MTRRTARLITIHTRRLQELEARAALEGARTPPEVQIEIDGMRRALARLRA